LEEIFDYTNFILNIGNFIQPALDAKLFSEVIIVGAEADFNRPVSSPYWLDLDMDIFANDMNYIPQNIKMKRIREWIKGASAATIATSPYFVDQTSAVNLIKKLFAGL
jgi:hypothetical protein